MKVRSALLRGGAEPQESEFDFYLADLNPRAATVLAGAESPVRKVAAERNIPVIELHPDPALPAGTFSLSGSTQAGRLSVEFSEPDDTALVLHTSALLPAPSWCC